MIEGSAPVYRPRAMSELSDDLERDALNPPDDGHSAKGSGKSGGTPGWLWPSVFIGCFLVCSMMLAVVAAGGAWWFVVKAESSSPPPPPITQVTPPGLGSSFLGRSDFLSDESYGGYVKGTIREGSRVRAIAPHESVTLGMEGTYYGTEPDLPDWACVVWDTDLGSASTTRDNVPLHLHSHIYWVYWYEVEILRHGTLP